MIENPSNFADQFKNFIEHIAGLMKTYYSKSGGTISGNVEVIGNFTATGSVTGNTIEISSDKNLKENIKLIKKVDLSSLGVYSYNYKSNPKDKRIGLLSQEVQKIYPDAVKNHDGKLLLDYNAIVSLLVLKNQELEQRIKKLEEK